VFIAIYQFDYGYFLLYYYFMISNAIKFITSKKRETERLVGLFNEYKWFVKNDFPIVLPRSSQSTKDDLLKKSSQKKLFVLANQILKDEYNKDKYLINKNFEVKILDAEAENITHEETILNLKLEINIFVIFLFMVQWVNFVILILLMLGQLKKILNLLMKPLLMK